MHKWTARAARTVLVAAAITAAGTGVANADHTRGDHSIAGGNQIAVPITVPVAVQGNNVSLLDNLLGGTNILNRSGARLTSIHMRDNQPAGGITLCGNAISARGGVGTAACRGRAMISDDPAPAPQVAPVAPAALAAPAVQAAPAGPPAPADTIGAPAGLIGAPGALIAPAAEAAAAPAVAEPAKDKPISADAPAIAKTDTAVPATDAAADQAAAPARAPLTICGNAAAAGGVATATCDGRAIARHHHMNAAPAFGALG